MLFKFADCAVLEEISQTATIHKDNNSEWNFQKRPGMLYVVARAVTADIPNGNGDFFSYQELKKAYKTFIDKGVFVNHASNDAEKMRGKILDAKLVDDDKKDIYVKCLLEINEMAFPELATMIRSGHIDSFSMGLCEDTDEFPQYILMKDLSYKRYKDVEVSDMVITHDGTVGPVVAKGREYFNDLKSYKISVEGIKEKIVISHDHKLLTLKRAARPVKKQVLSNTFRKEDVDYVRIEAKKRRIEAGLSINKTRRLLGFSSKSYENFENGDNQKVKLRSIRKICNLFNIYSSAFSHEAEDYIEAEKIQEGDYLLSPIYLKIQTLDEIDINTAKLLGWYLAEGSNASKNCFEFTLHLDETEFANQIEMLAKQIDSNARVSHYFKKDEIKGRKIVVYSPKIKNIINKHVFGKANQKYVSSEILSMEFDKQLAMIGTYIDGDGCLAEKYRKDKEYGIDTKNSIQISTASAFLCKQIPMMLARSGILSSTCTQFRKPAKNSVVKVDTVEHTIYIGATYVDLLKNYSSKVAKIKNESKGCKRSFIYKNWIASPITSIEEFNFTGVGYNIQVGSDENDVYKANHSYILNGIVSKNCQVAYSTCSICSHAAKTTRDYCMHVKMHKGGTYGNKQVYEDNHNIEFIELSIVSKPADSTAKVLEVLARKKGYDLQSLMQKAASSEDPNFIENLQNNVSVDKAVLAGIRRANQIRGKK